MIFATASRAPRTLSSPPSAIWAVSSFVTSSAASSPLVVTGAVVLVGTLFVMHKNYQRRLRLQELLSKPVLESLWLTPEDNESRNNNNNECIYLDYNGTTSIHPLVLAAMLPFLMVHFGNPSSSHAYGRIPQRAVTNARQSILRLLGTKDPSTDNNNSLWFTGCGTESDNLAIALALQSSPEPNPHIVTTNVEHPAIEKCLQHWQAAGRGVEVTYVPVQPNGRVRAEDVVMALRDNTVLVTVMLANNESGALMPIREIGHVCRQRNILVHTDAAQACGKVCLSELLRDKDDQQLVVDMVTLVGHKMGAPKGIAALYVKPHCLTSHGRSLPPNQAVLLHGGGQEFGRRGGTENVPYMVGMGKAADLSLQHLDRNMRHMEHLRTTLLEGLQDELDGVTTVRPNGPSDASQRLPNTLSVGIKGIQSGTLLSSIQDKVAASAGAACHSSSSSGGSISSVLRAMKVPTEYATGTLRLSVGPTTTIQDIQKATKIIADEVKTQLQTQ